MRSTKRKTSLKGMKHAAHTLWWPDPNYQEEKKSTQAQRIAQRETSEKSKSRRSSSTQ